MYILYNPEQVGNLVSLGLTHNAGQTELSFRIIS